MTTSLPSQDYAIGSSEVSVAGPNWQQSIPACGNITYNLLIDGTSYASSPLCTDSALAFNTTDGSYNLSTTLIYLRGIYHFTLIANSGAISANSSFL